MKRLNEKTRKMITGVFAIIFAVLLTVTSLNPVQALAGESPAAVNVQAKIPFALELTGGAADQAMQYRFTLKAKENAPLPNATSADTEAERSAGKRTKVLTSAGNDSFDITYSATGTYKYVLTQTTEKTEGFSLDSDEYEVTVHISADDKGKAQAEVAIKNLRDGSLMERALFSNNYETVQIEEEPSAEGVENKSDDKNENVGNSEKQDSATNDQKINDPEKQDNDGDNQKIDDPENADNDEKSEAADVTGKQNDTSNNQDDTSKNETADDSAKQGEVSDPDQSDDSAKGQSADDIQKTDDNKTSKDSDVKNDDQDAALNDSNKNADQVNDAAEEDKILDKTDVNQKNKLKAGGNLRAVSTRNFVIHSTDYDGNDISVSEFGSGFTLNYYKIPVSAFRITDDAKEITWSELVDGLYSMDATTRDTYLKRVAISSRDASFGLEMAPATADDPYYLIFMGDDDSVNYGAMTMPEWSAHSVFWYDGTSIDICADSATINKDDDYVVNVIHDASLFTPKITFRFDTSLFVGDKASLYPATIQFDGSDTITTINKDGDYTVDLPIKISRNEINKRASLEIPQPFGAIMYTATLKNGDSYGWEASSNDLIHSDSYYKGKGLVICSADNNDNLLGFVVNGGKPQISSDKLIISFTKKSDPSKMRFNIHTTDYDGNAISEDELGDGYDLYYLDVPLSVQNEMFREGYGYTLSDLLNGRGQMFRSNVLSGSPESYTGVRDDSSRFWRYLKSVHISSPDQKIVIEMNNEASSSNPYVILFVGDTNRSTSMSEWYAETQFFYDGSKFYTFNYGQPSPETQIDTNVVVRHDDTMVTPKLTVQFDASAYTAAGGTDPYPVSCFVVLSHYYNSESIIGEGTATEDGEMIISLNRKISRRALESYDWGGSFTSFTLRLMDTEGKVIQNDWEVSNNFDTAGSPNGLSIPIYDLDEEGNIIGGHYDSNTHADVANEDKSVVKYTRSLTHDTLRIDTYEYRDGQPVSSETIGAGYDLVYYEIPASIWSDEYNTWNKDYVLANAYMPRTMLIYPSSTPRDYSQYKKSIHIESNSKTIDISEFTKNISATEEKPYVYIFIGEDRSLENGNGFATMEWDSSSCFMYDGNQSYTLSDMKADNNVIIARVGHDDSLVKPKLKIKMDASDFVTNAGADVAAYPVKVTATSGYYYRWGTATAEVNADGEAELQFEGNFSRLRDYIPYYMACPIAITIQDETASNANPWYLKNTELQYGHDTYLPNQTTIYFADIDEDGYVHTAIQGDYNEEYDYYEVRSGDICVPEFEKISGQKPNVKIYLSADEDDIEESEFPLYLKVTAIDEYDNSWQSTKVIPINSYDLNREFSVGFEKGDPYLVEGMGSDENYLNFKVEVFKDEACTTLDEGWENINGTNFWERTEDYNSDGVWTVYRRYSPTGQYVDDYEGALVLSKNVSGKKPKVKVCLSADPDLFDESELPLYLQVTVIDSYDSSWQETKVIPVTADDLNNNLIIAFDRYDPYLANGEGYNDNPLNFRLTVYKDEACTEIDNGWGYNNGSQYWSWISENNNTGIWSTYRSWYDSTTGSWKYDYEAPLTMYYNFVKPAVPYSSFTNNSEGLYPAYLKINGFGQEKVIELTENTDGTVSFGKMYSSNIYGNNITWSVYSDKECTTLHEGWNVKDKSIQVGWNGSMLVEYSNYNTPAAIDLTKIQTDTLTIPMETSIGDFDETVFFPAYLTAVLHSEENLFTDVVVKKKLNSLGDANGDLEFEAKEGEKFTSDGEYSLYAVITTEEIEVTSYDQLYEYLPNDEYAMAFQEKINKSWAQAVGDYWMQPDITATLQGDGKLHQGLSELKLVYKPVTVDVQPDLFKVKPDEDTHVYVKTWLQDYMIYQINGNNWSYDPLAFDFQEITDNSIFTVSFPVLGFVGADLSAVSVMTENGTDDALDFAYNFEIPTSEGTYFYSDSQSSNMGADGAMRQSGNKVVLKPFESNKAYSSINVPVKVHIPEDGNYYFYNDRKRPDTGSPNEWAFYSLWRINPETGDKEYLSNRTGYYWNYGAYSSTAIRLANLNVDWEGSINNSFSSAILPGTYYLDYGLSYIWNSTYASTTNLEHQWTNEKAKKVILTQDGKLTWEDGSPVELHYYYNAVLPNIDVQAEYPDGSAQYNGNSYSKNLAMNDENEYTPKYFHYEMKSINGNGVYWSDDIYLRTGLYYDQREQVANVPEGKSYIGSPYKRYLYLNDLYYTYSRPDEKPEDYSYNSDIVIASGAYGTWYYSGTPYVSFGNMSQYGYSDDRVEGYPSGDYYLTYYSGDSDEVRDKWYKEKELKVHYAEDGKLYLINEDGTVDTEPYVMQIKYVGDAAKPENLRESLKIKINTTVKDGIPTDKAFTTGDTFVAMVTEFRNRNSSQRTDYYAVGTAQVTETGIVELDLKNPDGSDIVLHDDACYNLSYGTFHNWTGNFNTSSINKAWPVYNNLNNSYTYIYGSDFNHPNTTYPVYFTAANVDEDGNIKGFVYQDDPSGSSYYNYSQYMGRTSEDGDTDGEMLIFDNSSMIIPWSETNPGTISQKDTEDSVIYKPITDISAIKEKGNYIIVAQNQYNKKWYALYVDENGGNSVELSDISSFDDLEEGYKVDVSDEFRKMIFTSSKVTQGSDSVSLQLKSGYKDENGKYISVKMGESSDLPEPLLSSSAGTLIIRNADDKQFTVSKGNYSWLWYVDELYGWSGFTTISNKFGPKYAGQSGTDYLLYGLFNDSRYSREEYQKWVDRGSNPYGRYSTLGIYAGVSDSYSQYNKYMADVKESYLNNSYLNKLRNINSSYPGAGYSQFYILSDDVEEAEPEEPTNKYTLVKTFGDFVQTYAGTNGSQAYNMLLVYTDADGNEYAMESDKLYPVASKAGGSGYRTVTTVADHVLIPNNNSGTSSNFSIEPVEVKEDGTYVFATSYAFRKSRQNNTDNKNYMTMNGSAGDNAWTKNDDAAHGEGLVYVLHPSEEVYSQADWDATQSYKLSVVRNGVTSWLGVGEDENGNQQMVIVDSESDAVSFKIYTDRLTRYYSSAYGTDLYKYYKVNSITDINAGDEILIVYNDNGTKRIVGVPFVDNGRHVLQETYYSSYQISPAAEVLDEYSVLDTRDPDVVNIDSKYQYRLGTSEYVKKPFAYADSEDDTIIWAQGVAANAIGVAKSETKKQRKYESVSPLGNMQQFVYIKTGYNDAYSWRASETNFFPGDNEGEFFIRGGKSDAWLGTTHYMRNMLSLSSGNYEYSGNYLSFTTVGQADRIAVEIYRRPTTDEIFQIQYYSAENELDHTETKPKETFTLTQKTDIEKNGVKYVFVGYTTDYNKSGYLSLDDSANLYDYDDLSKVASIKKDIQKQHELLGDCNPEADNLIDFDDVEDKLVSVTSGDTTIDVLKVYPVYAVRGYSAAVTANDKDASGNDRMIVGASDFKDLQNGATGATDEKERWLGSINIEVYKDGELWVPGAGGSTIGKKLLAAPKPAQKATLYFAYHNDDAADLNIKFIADTVTQDTLYAYMSSKDFSQAEPSENYVIDAVYAEQGGSEDGLKYRFNWMDDEVGGQLDNVKGGSTVKIYVTTKYQVKFYLDKNDGNGYKLLTGTTWTNPEYYTTPGTQNAVEAFEETADYILTTDPETSYNMKLINQTPTEGTTFKDEKMIRGEYSEFLYKFNEYPHTIPIARLPEGDELPAGKSLEEPGSSGSWVIRDKELARLSDYEEKTDLPVTETTYGTGNSVWSYKGTDDNTNTYHLYAKVNSASADLKVTKKVPGAATDDTNEFSFTVTLGDTTVSGTYGDMTFTNGVATFKLKNGETATASGLPADITYKVEEQASRGYKTESEGATGTLADGETAETVFTNIPLVNIPVKKVWSDADDQDGKRPESVTFQLYQKIGTAAAAKVEGKTIVLTADDQTTDSAAQWSSSFNSLPGYDASGKKITYSVKELKADGTEVTSDLKYDDNYTVTYSSDNLTVTNTHIPEKTKVKVTKRWVDADDQDGKRASVGATVQLYKTLDGTKTAIGDAVDVSTADGWSKIWEDLPVYEGGKQIAYSVEENLPDGSEYTKSIDGQIYAAENGKTIEITITNSYIPENTKVTVEKTWNDSNDQDGKRASVGAKVQLYKTVGTIKAAVGDAVDVGTSDKWSKVWEDLPVYEGGKQITYSVEETLPDGSKYTKRGDSKTLPAKKDDSGTVTITNSYTPETTKVTVEKAWDDADDQDGIREDVRATVQLYKTVGGTRTAVKDAVDVGPADGWSYEWTGLPVNEGGKQITYSVEETLPNGSKYTKSGDDIILSAKVNDSGTVKITNTYTPEKTTIKGTKVWDDSDNQDGNRPESITVKLLAGGTETGKTVEVKADKDGKWTYEFADLDKYKAGQLVEYSVAEEIEDNIYNVTLSGDAGKGFEIKNTYSPEETSVKVTKYWNDANDQDGIRPESISVKLYADGEVADEAVLSEDNLWTHTWEGLARNKAGVAIEYTVEEQVPDGYIVEITGDSANGYNLINTHETEKTKVSVTKIWNDGNDQDGIRKDVGATVQLYKIVGADGVKTAVGTRIAVGTEDGWSHEWTDLPVNEGGKQITYSVEETLTDGSKYEKSGDETELPAVTEDSGVVTVTNSYTPETTKLKVEKTWVDENDQDGKRAEAGATVQLYKAAGADGEKTAVGEPVAVGVEDGWSHEWTGLPVYEGGEQITYSVEETLPEDSVYTKSGDDAVLHAVKDDSGSIVITNTHTPETTRLTVEKLWDDDDNQDGLREDANATVQLYKTVGDEGEKTAVGNAVLVGKTDSWSHDWTDLPVYEGGEQITYSVEEILPEDSEYSKNGDDAVITAVAGDSGTISITNTHKPFETEISVKKVWEDNDDAAKVRPKKITVKLLADGKETGTTAEIKADEDGSWAYEFTGLAKFKNGKEIEYTVEEEAVEWYGTEITGDAKEGFVIKNTVKPPVNIKLTKELPVYFDADGVAEGEEAPAAGAEANATTVFRIKVLDKDGKALYENYFSFKFTEAGIQSEDIELPLLSGAATLTVEEAYSAGYASTGHNTTVDLTAEDFDSSKTIEVGFENTFDENRNRPGGIINTYTDNDGDGKKEHSSR